MLQQRSGSNINSALGSQKYLQILIVNFLRSNQTFKSYYRFTQKCFIYFFDERAVHKLS